MLVCLKVGYGMKQQSLLLLCYFEMGLNGSRVIQIKNVRDHLNMCETLGRKSCPIYGDLDCVKYKGMDFNIAQSHTDAEPHPMSLHYLVVPQILLVPDFTLLEDISPSSLPELLEIIKGIAEMAIEGGQVGMGQMRVGYRDRWGVVGEREMGWAYDQVFNEGIIEGVYFSPQQMISYSQNRPVGKYDPIKTDVWALALLLVEIVFGESLAYIYDYQNFEIKLNPLLEKLQRIREEFGDDVASLFISMLEIEEEDRFSFHDVLATVTDILCPQPKVATMLSSNGQRPLDLSRGNRTPARAAPAPYARTPKNNDKAKYRNDVSPFRGRFGGAVKNGASQDRMRRTPERATESRSPMRRQFQAASQRDTFGVGIPSVSPLGRR